MTFWNRVLAQRCALVLMTPVVALYCRKYAMMLELAATPTAPSNAVIATGSACVSVIDGWP